jgi:Helicase associated domain
MVGTRRSSESNSPATRSSRRSKRKKSEEVQTSRQKKRVKKDSDDELDEEERLLAEQEEEDERLKAEEDDEEESDPMEDAEGAEEVGYETKARQQQEESRKAQEMEKRRVARNQIRHKGKAILEMDFSPEPTPTAILAESKAKKGNANTGLTPEWIAAVDDLRAYKEKHGNTRVPNRYPEDPGLAGWVKQQRRAYVKQQLSDGQRVSLEALGFEFIIEEEDKPPLTWDESFEQLKTFKDKHGHCTIPQGYEEMPVLQFWTFYQREMYRQKKLTQDQICKLEELGFTWDHTVSKEKAKPKSLDEVWNMQFDKLKAFKEKEGHPNGKVSFPSMCMCVIGYSI